MKKVFLYAYDQQNLGDDLFVYTITRRYPKVQFYMLTDKDNRKTFSHLPNLKVIDKDSRWMRLLHTLRPSFPSRYRDWLENRCGAVVYIGGSIFIEYDNWAQILNWWEYEAENRPFYVLGANFGPYSDEKYRQKLNEIFEKMQDVCFRDTYSYEKFFENSKVRRAPDILFGYPMPKVTKKKDRIFVSVIDCASRDDRHALGERDSLYINNMAMLIKGYLQDGYSVVLSSFCKAEGDERAIEKILTGFSEAEKRHITTLCYNGSNSSKILEEMAASAYIIATRFHATILAIAAGCAVLPIVYSDKTKNVLEDIGFDSLVYDLRDDGKWSYQESRRNLEKPTPMINPDVLRDAERHFEKLDHILI